MVDAEDRPHLQDAFVRSVLQASALGALALLTGTATLGTGVQAGFGGFAHEGRGLSEQGVSVKGAGADAWAPLRARVAVIDYDERAGEDAARQTDDLLSLTVGPPHAPLLVDGVLLSEGDAFDHQVTSSDLADRLLRCSSSLLFLFL
ncbi:hypothetical protein [Brevundimonas sp.]|uniref:hypothetical protein n=1 Tax=Brevundimonas sp. TaxID=1871086 RepID=UPI0028A67EBE|nr:hypothetical protein [Brevundimonas sp.]